MSELTAGEALEYATGEEFLKLYAVTCTGLLFGSLAGVGVLGGGEYGFALLFFLLSLPVVLVGVVATFHKLLEESA